MVSASGNEKTVDKIQDMVHRMEVMKSLQLRETFCPCEGCCERRSEEIEVPVWRMRKDSEILVKLGTTFVRKVNKAKVKHAVSLAGEDVNIPDDLTVWRCPVCNVYHGSEGLEVDSTHGVKAHVENASSECPFCFTRYRWKLGGLEIIRLFADEVAHLAETMFGIVEK